MAVLHVWTCAFFVGFVRSYNALIGKPLIALDAGEYVSMLGDDELNKFRMSVDGIPCHDGVGDVQVLRKFDYVLLLLVLLVMDSLTESHAVLLVMDSLTESHACLIADNGRNLLPA